jgi:hypothetical protein
MTVYIEKNDGNRYKWIVRVGRGRGSVIKSRHYKKRQAKKTAREIARDRGDVLKEQMHYGQWQTVTSY